LNIAIWADEQRQRWGDFPALNFEGQGWTLEQIYEITGRLAGGLLARGLKTGQRVRLALGNRPQTLFAFTAVLRAGGVAELLDPDDPKHRDQEVGRNLWPEGDFLSHPVERSPEDPALALYTSGTSGPAREKLFSHGLLSRRYLPFAARTRKGPPRRSLAVLPLSSAFGAQYLLLRLLQPMHLFLMERFEPGPLLECLERQHIQATMLVPSMLYSLLNHPEARPLPSLKSLRVGGARVSPQLIEQTRKILRVRLTVVYGMTELGPIAQSLPGDPGGLRLARPDLQMRVVDEQSQSLPPEVPGRLEFQEGAGPWFRSPDLGWLDPQGGLHILGRSDEAINQGGVKIYPEPLEEALGQIPGVEDCAVVGQTDPFLGEKAVACCVSSLLPQEIREALRRLVPPRELPAQVITVSQIPRNRLGKIQRFLLKPGQNGSQLLSWLAERLRQPQLELEQSFAQMGIDSLAAVQLAEDLGKWLGRPLPPTLLLNYPTPRALERYLGEGPAPKPSLSYPSSADATTPIAIVGIACRLPQRVNDPEEFWERLCQGADLTQPITRWKDLPVERAALLDLAPFDAEFFGLNAVEARNLHPQHRLALELSWQALEYAGIAPPSATHWNCGMFLGISSDGWNRDPIGGQPSMAVGRVCRFLDLHGPAMALDSSCSSSLVAIHQAMQSLRSGECSLALAGGVHYLTSPHSFRALHRLGTLSDEGRCRSFDPGANGMGRGEGGVIFVLQTLPQALRENRTVLATLQASALMQDGRSSSLTAPNGLAQQGLLRQVLQRAQWSPEELDYVEAHGSGTPLGDALELESLGAVFGGRTSPLQIGSVKTNLGHLEAAAGAVGLLKAVLMLRHQKVPPHLHLSRQPPPPLHIPTSLCQLPLNRAGVISLGMSGTHACVLLERAGQTPDPSHAWPEEEKPEPYLLCLSARSPQALKALQESYQQSSLHPDLAYTARVGRAHFACRRALVGHTPQELREELRHAPWPPGRVANPPPLAFLFTGQGCLRPGVGKQLWQRQRVFRQALERCESLAPGLLDELFEGPVTQRALLALQWSLVQLWASWGVRPDMLLGHSLGEITAACVAGVIRLEHALSYVRLRQNLMDRLPAGGGMLGVRLGEAETLALVGPDLDLAAVNGPARCVVSGSREDLRRLSSRLTVPHKLLEVDLAFHSRWLDPVTAELQEALQQLPLCPPNIPLYSGLTGKAVTDWSDGFRQPVRFHQALTAAYQAGARAFVEIGPAPVLTVLARENLSGELLVTPSLTPDAGEMLSMMLALGRCYEAGLNPDWQSLGPAAGRLVPAPVYPFSSQVPDARSTPTRSSDLRQMVAACIGSSPQELDPNANLLDAGLNSLRCLQLLEELRASYGVDFGLSDLLAHPTLAQLQAWLKRSTGPRSSLTLVKIRPEGSGLPLICLPPAGGQVACYLQFRQCPGFNRPVYACQIGSQPGSLAEIAHLCAQKIRQSFRGPVGLLGWSMGALLAHEVAACLEEEGGLTPPSGGEEAPQVRVDLIDPPAPGQPPPVPEELLSWLCLIFDRQGSAVGMPELLKLSREQLRALAGNQDPEPILQHFRLIRQHQPRPTRTPIRVWWASAAHFDWRPYATGPFQQQVLDGDHFSIIQTSRFSNLPPYLTE